MDERMIAVYVTSDDPEMKVVGQFTKNPKGDWELMNFGSDWFFPVEFKDPEHFIVIGLEYGEPTESVDGTILEVLQGSKPDL